MRFLVLNATICEEMTRDIIFSPAKKVDYASYEAKLAKYEPCLDAIMEDFQDSLFGLFLCRRVKETFIEKLT